MTPLRALVLQAYWALRRVRTPDIIGTPDILNWIRTHAPRAEPPSATLVRVTLLAAEVPHRKGGRPRRESTFPALATPPFLPAPRHLDPPSPLR